MHKIAAIVASLVLLPIVSVASAAMLPAGSDSDGPAGPPAARDGHGSGSGPHGGPRGSSHGGSGGGHIGAGAGQRNTGAPAGRGSDPGGGHRRGGGHGGVIVVPEPFWPGSPYPFSYPYPGSLDDSSDTSPPVSYAAHNNVPPRPFWYYCDQPDGYYPYVKTCTHDWNGLPIMAPPPAAPAPVADGTWEWCEALQGYFPYVASCPRGWTAVPVTAPQSEGAGGIPPASANWYYCDDPKGYLPYVSNCNRDWRAVPSIPPPNMTKSTK